jgi:hypothetical protein
MKVTTIEEAQDLSNIKRPRQSVWHQFPKQEPEWRQTQQRERSTLLWMKRGWSH